jgi:hypothetical protein
MAPIKDNGPPSPAMLKMIARNARLIIVRFSKCKRERRSMIRALAKSNDHIRLVTSKDRS